MVVVALCALGFIAAHLAPRPSKEVVWPSRSSAALVLACLVIGALLSLMTWAEGTSANGAIMLFFVLGFVGYLLMLRAILASNRTARVYLGSGGTLLLLTAIWSWTSAIGMYVYRGADKHSDEACILVPNPSEYDREIRSLWEMRLPEIASRRTSPSGSYIWEYHAILVARIDEQTEHYNWSKRWMRFDFLDAKRNPYLPPTCP